MLSTFARRAAARTVANAAALSRPVTATFSTASVSHANDTTAAAQSEDFPGVRGETLDHFLDLANVRVGERIVAPYEVTASDFYKDSWMAAFYHHDRLYTSSSFAEQHLKLHDTVLPFTMMVYMTGAMTHLDERREILDLSYRNCVYLRPAYSGDTFHKSYKILGLRSAKSSNNTIVDIHCELFNSSNEPVFSVIKTMMFAHLTPQMSVEARYHGADPLHSVPNSALRSHLIKNQENLPSPKSLKVLRPGTLVLHGMSRPIGLEVNMNLSSLQRMTHPTIFNLHKYGADELVVSGPLLMAAAHAASARGFYEVLYEDMESCRFLNKANPLDTIGAASYILDRTDVSHKLEEVTVCTLGLKNVEVTEELKNTKIPLALFTNPDLKPSEAEAICKKHVPMLQNKIVTLSRRRFIRQCPHDEHVFLL